MMEKLQSRINRELKFHQELMMLRGALDMTLAQVCCISFFILVDEFGLSGMDADDRLHLVRLKIGFNT